MSKTRDLALLAAGAAFAPRRETHQHHHHTEVHEHRAPTDESVRLLKEMEETAREKIIASFPLGSNEFDGRVMVELDGMNMEHVLTALIRINDKLVRAQVREYADGRESIRQALPKLRDALAKAIADEVLAPAISASVIPALLNGPAAHK